MKTKNRQCEVSPPRSNRLDLEAYCGIMAKKPVDVMFHSFEYLTHIIWSVTDNQVKKRRVELSLSSFGGTLTSSI